MNTIVKMSIVAASAALVSCGGVSSFSDAEKALINEGEGPMRVLTIADSADSLLLRRSSAMIGEKDLRSPEFAKLASRMIATVTDPSQDGVGIAGPQVGLLRRVVAVQRLDMEGEPFVVYPNITLEPVGEACRLGPEGCLSVPDMRGDVRRYDKVVIRYVDAETLETKEELVEGFTAVIFQHECDHLEGTLYIDRML